MILLGTFFCVIIALCYIFGTALLDGQGDPLALAWGMLKVMLPMLAACRRSVTASTPGFRSWRMGDETVEV